MGTKSVSTNLPSYFNNVVKDMNEVVNQFNSYFIHIGSNLAELIKNRRNQNKMNGKDMAEFYSLCS